MSSKQLQTINAFFVLTVVYLAIYNYIQYLVVVERDMTHLLLVIAALSFLA